MFMMSEYIVKEIRGGLTARERENKEICEGSYGTKR
jgi:hypothetical protein